MLIEKWLGYGSRQDSIARSLEQQSKHDRGVIGLETAAPTQYDIILVKGLMIWLTR